MPKFKAGDIVVWRNSRSNDLKRKVFRVTTLPAEYGRVIVENWRGHQRKISEYYLELPNRYEETLDMRIEMANREEARARLRATKQRAIKQAFVEKKHEINGLFKPI